MPTTIINNLTIADIRKMKEQLCRQNVLPVGRSKFMGWIHPVSAVSFVWSAGNYWLSLKLWYNVWTSFDADLILNSIPWRYYHK